MGGTAYGYVNKRSLATGLNLQHASQQSSRGTAASLVGLHADDRTTVVVPEDGDRSLLGCGLADELFEAP